MIAVKFIIHTLTYIAEVVLRTGEQENESMEDDDGQTLAAGDAGELVVSEMQELLDNDENVCIYCARTFTWLLYSIIHSVVLRADERQGNPLPK